MHELISVSLADPQSIVLPDTGKSGMLLRSVKAADHESESATIVIDVYTKGAGFDVYFYLL